jgi:hypothetical protein
MLGRGGELTVFDQRGRVLGRAVLKAGQNVEIRLAEGYCGIVVVR